MSSDDYPVIFVTGASSGIGLALVKQLKTLPYRIVATAREASLPLITDAGIVDSDAVMVRALDLNRVRDYQELFSEIERVWDGVDILVNNAGVAYRSALEQISDQEELAQLQVNYLGAMSVIREVLPSMRRKRAGRIINISSVGGMMAMPTMGSYSASKFALEGASEALWYELKPWNISVSLIQPGFINSNSFKRVILSSGAKRALESDGPYAIYYREMSTFIERLMNGATATPEGVAAKIITVAKMRDPPLRVPATLDAHLFAILRRLLPRRIYHAILYRGLPGIKGWGR